MIWTADTVMYDGISMDRAYSGSTLIWCKTCPVITCGLERVHQGEPIIAGQDYMIADSTLNRFLGENGRNEFTASNAMVLHADKTYPAVYEGLCEGYVTDLGAAFGLERIQGGTFLDYGYRFSTNKRSLSTFIGYDYKNPHNPGTDIIMTGSYLMQSYYLNSSDPRANELGFELLPGMSGTAAYATMYLYRINYCYQS